MDLSKSNSLVELYFNKYKKINNSEKFLLLLKPKMLKNIYDEIYFNQISNRCKRQIKIANKKFII